MIKHAILFILTLACSLSAQAAPNEALTRYFQKEFSETRQALEACHAPVGEEPQGEQAWFLRRFWLRTRAKVAFAIPGFARLEIVPETELLWQRELPEGWATYKP